MIRLQFGRHTPIGSRQVRTGRVAASDYWVVLEPPRHGRGSSDGKIIEKSTFASESWRAGQRVAELAVALSINWPR
jgi:hypothetical protein